MAHTPSIPVLDLFAGPGGLGEGFSSFRPDGHNAFRVCLSLENDPWAHRTLHLRSFYRQFQRSETPDEYYSCLKGDIGEQELFSLYPSQIKAASLEARCIEIGPKNRQEIKRLITKRVKGNRAWVLIGGPPCQAYSLVGRSRVLGADRRNKTNKYETDARHTLYKEYLRIIADHWPPIFVMENVKGLLSSRHNGQLIFPGMLTDLQDPGKSLRRPGRGRYRYEILSFIKKAAGNSDLTPADYVIRTENYGLPQSRHRLILLGIRNDLLPVEFARLKKKPASVIEDALSDVPPVRSGLSKTKDSDDQWRSAIKEVLTVSWLNRLRSEDGMAAVAEKIENAVKRILVRDLDRGGEYLESNCKPRYGGQWFRDTRLGGLCNHTTRVHIKEDLHRYLFAACYAKVYKKSPILREYPRELLPDHRNAEEAVRKGTFEDRFRVQVSGRPSTTITSHMAKDGHHFIHPDPTQCRSLTVREAARLQTFPEKRFIRLNPWQVLDAPVTRVVNSLAA